jgi:hypothetical protein
MKEVALCVIGTSPVWVTALLLILSGPQRRASDARHDRIEEARTRYFERKWR